MRQVDLAATWYLQKTMFQRVNFNNYRLWGSHAGRNNAKEDTLLLPGYTAESIIRKLQFLSSLMSSNYAYKSCTISVMRSDRHFQQRRNNEMRKTLSSRILFNTVDI